MGSVRFSFLNRDTYRGRALRSWSCNLLGITSFINMHFELSSLRFAKFTMLISKIREYLVHHLAGIVAMKLLPLEQLPHCPLLCINRTLNLEPNT